MKRIDVGESDKFDFYFDLPSDAKRAAAWSADEMVHKSAHCDLHAIVREADKLFETIDDGKTAIAYASRHRSLLASKLPP